MKKFLDFTTMSVAGAMLISGILSLTGENFACARHLSAAFPDRGRLVNTNIGCADYNGYLAVFGKESESPELIFQVYRNLPQYDQQALQDGIGVRDYEELVARIEDFIS